MKATISIPSDFNEINLESHEAGYVSFWSKEVLPSGNYANMDVHFEAYDIYLNEFKITYIAFDEEGKNLIDIEHIQFLLEPITKVMEQNRKVIADALHNEWQQSEEYKELPNHE
jgi:hypothetical protein